jgi:hypothetical protein
MSLVLLLLCIFAFWWGISVFSRNVSTGNQVVVSSNAVQRPLIIKETHSDDEYTYSGTYLPKNPCEQLGSGIRFVNQNGGEVTILLTTALSATECAQANDGEQGIPFSVSIKDREKPHFMGVLLNSIEVPSELVH